MLPTGLCAVVVVGFRGFRTGGSLLAKGTLGNGLPPVLVVVWAMVIAPNAAVHLSQPLTIALGLLLLLLSAAALGAAGSTWLGATFGVVIVVNAVLMILWHQ